MTTVASPDDQQNSVSPREAQALRRGALGVLIVVAALAQLLTPAGAVKHTVAPGEALSTIAETYSVTIDEVVSANDLSDPDLIFAGQVLEIPGSSASGPAARRHNVIAGETLSQISAVYGISTAALAETNNIDNPALIFVGQVLVVGQGAAAVPETSHDHGLGPSTGQSHRLGQSNQSPPEGGVRSLTHTVIAGDSLWAISARYGMSIDDLMLVNGLGGSTVITPGQKLAVFDGRTFGIDVSELPRDLATDPDRLQLMFLFDRWAEAYDVPPELIKALSWFESGWNNELESSAGALGIGQVLPITADFVSEVLIGERLDPYDIEENIRLSTRYLKYLLDETGRPKLAVASYYQGLTATRREGIYESSEFYVEGVLALRERFD